MHVTRLTVKRLVLQTGGFGRGSQFAFDPRPGEGLDGPHPGPGLEHGLVLRTCGLKQHCSSFTVQVPPEGKVSSEVHGHILKHEAQFDDTLTLFLLLISLKVGNWNCSNKPILCMFVTVIGVNHHYNLILNLSLVE